MGATIPYDADELVSFVARYWSRAEWEDFLRGEIYDQIYLEEEQLPLRELLIPADYTLLEEESIDNILTRIKYPRSTATWGRPEVGAHPVTIPKPEKEQIEAYLMVAKSRWDFNTAKSAMIRSREDAVALSQIVTKENELIVQHIYSNLGALTVDPANGDIVTLDDLLALERVIKVSDTATAGREGEGGRMTHVILHPNQMELLQNDERILNNLTEVGPTGQPLAQRSPANPEESGAQFYRIAGRSWWLCSTNYATAGTIAAYDYYRYLVEAIKMEVETIPYDESLAGIGNDKGNQFLSMIGFGLEPFGAQYNCSMTL